MSTRSETCMPRKHEHTQEHEDKHRSQANGAINASFSKFLHRHQDINAERVRALGSPSFSSRGGDRSPLWAKTP